MGRGVRASGTSWTGPLIVFVGACGYFLLFRRYGFLVEDEGTLLARSARVAAGDVPYVDFHTVYAPGGYYLGALVFRTAGESLVALRTVMALLNALTAAVLYLVAARVAGRALAFLPPLAWVAFMPIFPGEFASFNVPYPAWMAVLAWLGVAVAMLGWCAHGGVARLAAAGAGAGIALALKPNAGVYALAAATWVLPLAVTVRGRWDRPLVWLASAGTAAGVLASFTLAWRPAEAVVLLGPAAGVLALALGPLAGRWRSPRHPRPGPALAALAAGFAAPTVLWAAPLVAALGPAGLLREAFFLGTDAAVVYSVAYPPPEPLAVASVVGCALAAMAGRALAVGRVGARPVLAAAAAGALVALWGLRAAPMPEGWAAAVANGLENVSFWLAPLVNWGAVLLLAAVARRGAAGDHARALAVTVPFAVAMYLQIYPRTDFTHVVFAVPLTAVAGAALLARVTRWWAQGLGARVVPVGLVVAVCAVAAVGARLAPALAAVRASRSIAPLEAAGRRLPVGVEEGGTDDLTALGTTVDFVRAHTREGEAVLAFPALGAVLYGSGTRQPVAADYWFPGFPDETGARPMVAALAAAPPRLVVTLNDGWTFFFESPGFYAELRALIVARYRPIARFGRFDVLARSDLLPALGPCRSWVPVGPSPPPLARQVGHRRQAGRRWMAGLDAAEARRARLPADPRAAILLLRTIRDGGDLRAAGWLVAGHTHPSARVRAEAAVAMGQVARGFASATRRWANDLTPADYAPFVAPYRGAALAMLRAPGPARDLAAAILLSLDADRRRRLRARGAHAAPRRPRHPGRGRRRRRTG